MPFCKHGYVAGPDRVSGVAIKIPIITVRQPWATLIARGHKSIETRRHKRFLGLVGSQIGIHAGREWDKDAGRMVYEALDHYKYVVSDEAAERIYQLTDDRSKHIFGAILCTANVAAHRLLDEDDSLEALIRCLDTGIYGLDLADVREIPPIACSGKQGIWCACVQPLK